MFTKQAIRHTIWSRQRDNSFPIASRSVSVNFSLGSRSSLVRYSLVYRGPNEEQTKKERKSDEYRSRCRREAIENPTRSPRHGLQNTLLQPQTSIQPLTLLLPRQTAVLSVPLRHSYGESSHSYPFCKVLVPTTAKAPHRPQKAFSAPNPTTAQNTPPYPLHPPYHSMATESAIASTAGQTPRFRKAKRAELSTLKLCHDEKRYHKMEPSPKTTQNHSISSFCPQTRTITLQQRHTTHPIDLHYI